MEFIESFGSFGDEINNDGSFSILYNIKIEKDQKENDDCSRFKILLKKDVYEKSRSLENGLVAKKGHITNNEFELSKMNLPECIIKCFGFSSDMISNQFLIFPKCQKNLNSIARPISDETLKKFDTFFETVFNFFQSINYCYLDWKPSNILVDYDNSLKLCDLGSCSKSDVEIVNPKNVNILYTSPFLLPFFEKITPRPRDDLIGICYVYLWLLNYKSPWEYLNIDLKNANGQLEDMLPFLLTIFQLKCDKRVNRIDFTKYNKIPAQYKNEIERLQNMLKYCLN